MLIRKKVYRILGFSLVLGNITGGGVCANATGIGKKLTSVFSSSSTPKPNKLLGAPLRKNDLGFNVYKIGGVKLESSSDIENRDKILESLKLDITSTKGNTAPRDLFWILLQHEPDSFKRDLKDGTRVYKHKSSDGSINVKIKVDNTGDLDSVNVRLDQELHKMDLKNSKYTFENLENKSEMTKLLSTKDKGAIPKKSSILSEVKEDLDSKTKIKFKYSPQENSQKLIDDMHKTKGENVRLINEAILTYTGDVETTTNEKVYRFVGNDKDMLTAYTDNEGNVLSVLIFKNDDPLEKVYSDELQGMKYYKSGFFEVKGSNQYQETDIFTITDETGQEKFVIKNPDGTISRVLDRGNNIFAKVLDRKTASIYSKVRDIPIIEAKNMMGENKRVVLQEVEIQGIMSTYAYQIDDGIWREVVKGADGTLWVGSVVKYENLSSEIISILRSAAKKYRKFFAPIVGGASGFAKTLLK